MTATQKLERQIRDAIVETYTCDDATGIATTAIERLNGMRAAVAKLEATANQRIVQRLFPKAVCEPCTLAQGGDNGVPAYAVYSQPLLEAQNELLTFGTTTLTIVGVGETERLAWGAAAERLYPALGDARLG